MILCFSIIVGPDISRAAHRQLHDGPRRGKNERTVRCVDLLDPTVDKKYDKKREGSLE